MSGQSIVQHAASTSEFISAASVLVAFIGVIVALGSCDLREEIGGCDR
jgi:hypothetical protein